MENILNSILDAAIERHTNPLKELLCSLLAKLDSPKRETPNNLLSRKETAAFLKCSLVHLWQLGRKGYLKPKISGKKVYYFYDDIINYLELKKCQ